MPFVNTRIVREAIAADPAGKKADIAAKVTSAVTEAAGLGNDDVWAVFEEVNARDRYVCTTDVETLRKGLGGCDVRVRAHRFLRHPRVCAASLLAPP